MIKTIDKQSLDKYFKSRRTAKQVSAALTRLEKQPPMPPLLKLKRFISKWFWKLAIYRSKRLYHRRFYSKAPYTQRSCDFMVLSNNRDREWKVEQHGG